MRVRPDDVVRAVIGGVRGDDDAKAVPGVVEGQGVLDLLRDHVRFVVRGDHEGDPWFDRPLLRQPRQQATHDVGEDRIADVRPENEGERAQGGDGEDGHGRSKGRGQVADGDCAGSGAGCRRRATARMPKTAGAVTNRRTAM